MPNPTPFALAVFLLLLCAVAAILVYRASEARVALKRWAPWLVAAGTGVLWLLSLLRWRSAATPPSAPAAAGDIARPAPTPPRPVTQAAEEARARHDLDIGEDLSQAAAEVRAVPPDPSEEEARRIIEETYRRQGGR